MRQITIEQLDKGQLVEAWPLVRMAATHTSADWWIGDATLLMERGGGILAARAPGGAIHGIATYEVARKYGFGRVLAVSTLLAFELSGRAPVKRMLCDSLKAIAAAFGCDDVVAPS